MICCGQLVQTTCDLRHWDTDRINHYSKVKVSMSWGRREGERGVKRSAMKEVGLIQRNRLFTSKTFHIPHTHLQGPQFNSSSPKLLLCHSQFLVHFTWTLLVLGHYFWHCIRNTCRYMADERSHTGPIQVHPRQSQRHESLKPDLMPM